MQDHNPREYWNAIADAYLEATEISLDDFHYGPLIDGDRQLKLLPKLPAQSSALELGCGAAQNSIYLTQKMNLACTALDLSQAMLSQELCTKLNTEISLHQANLDNLSDDLPEELGSFDLIHSVHALQFVQDPAKLFKWVAKHLNPAGTLLFSTHHPLFSVEWLELDEDEWGFFMPSYFGTKKDQRETPDNTPITSFAYPIEQWVIWLRDAGFVLTDLREPKAMHVPTLAPYKSSTWLEYAKQLSHCPATLILKAQLR